MFSGRFLESVKRGEEFFIIKYFENIFKIIFIKILRPKVLKIVIIINNKL